MPRISIFFGIVIYIYYDDHNPPHFHASYEGLEGFFDFEGNMIRGYMPGKAQKSLSKNGAGFTKKNLKKTGKMQGKISH